jgi:hypothetical protein
LGSHWRQAGNCHQHWNVMSVDLRVYEFSKVDDNHFDYLLIFIPKVIVNEENAHDTQEFLTKRLSAIKNQRSTGELEDLALVIGKIFS